MRLFLFLTIGFLFLASGTSALASSDGGCSLDWKLVHQNHSGCSNMAILQPGNDTRVNMMLMIADSRSEHKGDAGGEALFHWGDLSNAFYPQSKRNDGFSNGRPSRCQTNDSGRDAFVKAVRRAEGLKDDEREALIEARQSVEPECDGDSDGLDNLAKLPAVGSSRAKEFVTYLSSALAFYHGDFDDATKGFSSLARAKNTWIKEAALYMIARSELNRSQAGAVGKYGYFQIEKVDQPAVTNAVRGFKLYRKIYPQGEYTNSARGLLRRAYWFGGDTEQLSNEYSKLIGEAPASMQEGANLIAEMDDKLLPGLVKEVGATSDPKLLAMILLYRMRDVEYNYIVRGELPKLTLTDIEAVREQFSDRQPLYEYLLASHAFYVAKKPADVLRLIPDDARQANFSYLEFSRQALRGMALEAVNDRNARGFWREVMIGSNGFGQRKAVELALAMNLERGGGLAQVFEVGSPITDASMRDILMLKTAGPDLLRKQSQDQQVSQRERNLALYTLLYKSLTRGRYSDFVKHLSLVPTDSELHGPYFGFQYEYDYGYEENAKIPVGMFAREMEYDDFDCPQLKQTASTLRKNAKSHKARICLADYLRLAGFDDYWLDEKTAADQLGGSKSLFPGKPVSRLEVYKDIISDSKAKGDVRAYALYRAVWCYGPSGSNSCGGKEVKEDQRAAWFRQLKRNHANTRWAKKLEYYW